MKVVRKGKCEPKPVEMDSMEVIRKKCCKEEPTVVMVADIKQGTVFSGHFKGYSHCPGVFVKCQIGCVTRLSGSVPNAYVYNTTHNMYSTICDYKEENAYICIND